MNTTVRDLIYRVNQLLSDVESSTAGQGGAHKKCIAWVREGIKAVETDPNDYVPEPEHQRMGL